MPIDTYIAAADQGWPEAAIAIAGIALVGSVIAVIVWQAMATARTRMTAARDEAYRELADRTARELRELNAHLRGGGRSQR